MRTVTLQDFHFVITNILFIYFFLSSTSYRFQVVYLDCETAPLFLNAAMD
jgi:hypothetical protein